MTPAELEARILNLAWSRGLLPESPEAVRPVAGNGPFAFGPRIQALLDRGALSRELAEALAWEVGREGFQEPVPPTALPDAWTMLADTGDRQGAASFHPVETLAWERYQFLEFLAAGGSGRIYKAFDPSLQRWVALKFLKEGIRARQDHILREARAQAQVEHPHICRVYEVAEVEGIPYISMQLVGGETFHHALGALDVPDKVAIVRDVAEGIHAAHRLGLLHLDLKPGNILLERREGGRPHAFVADFGAGRLEGAADEDLAMGTPPYASPEQVAGKGAALDRRSDIYSLGVTLYVAVSGKWPFRGTSQTELLEQISGESPRPLRTVAPDLSRDLEAVLAKAMARSPAHRYASALAFAEDLQRFLDGEPVEARKGTVAYRVRKWARRHRSLALAAGLGLAAVALTGGLLAAQARRLKATARFVQEFSLEVERIEALVRYMRMQPAHDVRPELAVIQGRLLRLQERIGAGGRPALGPGHHALGRGYYALGRWEEARAELDKAYALGHRTPELELDLGRTLASLYMQKRFGVGFVVDEATRRQQEAQLARELGVPAAEHLRRGSSENPAVTAYVEALLAYCEDRPARGLAKTKEALATAPWMVEAVQLQGFIAVAGMGSLSPEAGDRVQTSGESPIREALRLAPSDTRLYYLEASRWWNIAKAQSVRSPFDQFLSLDRGLQAVEAGLRINPDAGELLQQEARFLYLHAQESERLGRGGAAERIEAARRAADRASAVEPANMNAWRTRASVYGTLAEQKLHRGEAAEPDLQEGLASMDKALALGTPRPSGLRYVAWLHSIRAEAVRARGGDPRPALADAIRIFEEVLRSDPAEAYTLQNLATLQADRALWELEEGRPDPGLTEALARISRRCEQDPEDAEARAVKVRVLGLAARSARVAGLEALPALHAARREAEVLTEMPGRTAQNLVEAALVEVEAATQAAARGGDPAPAFRLARQRLAAARRLHPKLGATDLALAELCLAEGVWRRARGGRATAVVLEGSAACGRVLAAAPGLLQARALRGALGVLDGQDARARGELEAAMAAAPHLRVRFGGLVPARSG
ncbi:MAG: serine/threonine protein kinase [Holophagaceae bacterium]|nr:serine/threonine protein kinase [Holophagaceae bacterium]